MPTKSDTRSNPSPLSIATKRNGHGRVLGELVRLASAAPFAIIDRLGAVRLVRLTLKAENLLRDADAEQIGRRGLVVAREGNRREWRSFLADHFRRNHRLHLVFDAEKMRVE